MKLKDQNKINKVLSIILLVFWCILIFSFSNQVGSVSESSSDQVIDLINNIFKFLSIPFNAYNFPKISFIVRKLAHMFLYFNLYLITYYVTYSYKINRKAFYSLLFCLLYAISDEVHQLFIVERSFGIIDILIDIVGSLFAFFLLKIKKK